MGRLVPVVALVLISSLIPLSSAFASTWAVAINGNSGGDPLLTGFQVALADPTGGATTNVGGIPVQVARSPGGFGISVNVVFQQANCLFTIALGGSGAIQSTPVGQVATFPLTGNINRTCSGSGSAGGSGSTDSQVNAQVVATDISGTNSGSVQNKTGTVTFNSPTGSQQLQPGQPVPPNTEIATGTDGQVTVTAQDNSNTTVRSNSRVALGNSLVDVIFGRIDRVSGAGQPSSILARTGTATMREVGTDYSATYSQTGTNGSTVITVRSGSVEVTDRRNQRTTVTAGQEQRFDDLVPRVLLILPSDQGTVVPNRGNIFSWTAFAGAQNYLLEFNASQNGFVTRNASAPENPALTFRLPLGLFTESGGVVTFTVPIPGGIPSGTRAFYRVFAADSNGQVLPGSTASDSHQIVAQ